MPNCAACGAELEPLVRVPHIVYVKTLYRIAGQDYRRHHIIRAAVAAGVITVVERTHSWLNRFRRILIRWDESPDNYIPFLHFACALTALRAAGLLG